MQMIRNSSNKNTTNSITQDHQHNYNYNNNYTTLPGVSQDKCLSPDDCELIKDAYCNNISDTMTMAVANIIEKAYENGITVDEIIMAIEDTGMARNPTPWYLKKILENWAESGVTFSRMRHKYGANHAKPWWK